MKLQTRYHLLNLFGVAALVLFAVVGFRIHPTLGYFVLAIDCLTFAIGQYLIIRDEEGKL